MSIVKPSPDEGESTRARSSPVTCPICNKEFEKVVVEEHVNKCLFLNSQDAHANSKRSSSQFMNLTQSAKRIKLSNSNNSSSLPPKNKEPRKSTISSSKSVDSSSAAQSSKDSKGPLAEQMRPISLDHLVGQREAFGPGSMLRSLLEQNKIPNMILWGPPGCGKTSVAHIVANICKEQSHLRFVKLSATMSGISDVKEVVKVAKNEAQFKRQTVLFMDEIHRFNKLQQDTFLPHVESGTITLVGATTENPSFSLNNALLSRCRVVILEKLKVDDIFAILERALEKCKQAFIVDAEGKLERDIKDVIPRFLVERASLRWVAEVCDGDARVALGALELALDARDPGPDVHTSGPATLTLEDIQDGIKRSHMVYDHHGEEHYNTISALHKSVRAGDANAALYWTMRALHGGEDPLFIARRLVRAACEDIGLAEPSALVEAVACLRGCRQLGVPECDVLLAQCAVRLARAPKSRELYSAMKRCQRALAAPKGPLPPIPLHLRNASTELMKNIGYGRGYNLRHKDESGLQYMPEGMEDVNFFQESDSEGD